MTHLLLIVAGTVIGWLWYEYRHPNGTVAELKRLDKVIGDETND